MADSALHFALVASFRSVGRALLKVTVPRHSQKDFFSLPSFFLFGPLQTPKHQATKPIPISTKQRHGDGEARMAANGPTRGPRMKKNLRQGLFLFAQKVMGPCQRVGTWTAKGGYANWSCDERRLEWFRGPEWCAIDAACRAGDGNHARGAQASEPGPTWTHQRFGLIAWDKHIILARADKI
ncbi:hypothetical protein HDV62DRAFT_381165 [Trichoderma sp. SZMC 28011]